MNTPFDPADVTALPALLSVARLQPYLTGCSGDMGKAVRLYTWNLEISSAFWGELHTLEVSLRNALHDQMTRRYRQEEWWTHPVLQLNHPMVKQLAGAIREASATARRKDRSVVPGDVVAALNFGFWTGLLGNGQLQYETQFWQPALRNAFPFYAGKRSALQKDLDSIRLFRNRIAHHEPIFARHLAADHDSIVQVSGYISGDVASYINGLSRVPEVLQRRLSVVRTGIGSSF